MASKRYKFQVNTSSSCFLCLDEISNENISEGSSFSLKNIFQYLNIELNKIESLSTRPTPLLKKTDVRVSLCSNCGKTVKEISNLYRGMELIKMKLDFSFEIIHKRLQIINMENNKESGETTELFRRHSKLSSELREEILRKCDIKMPNYHPRVSLLVNRTSMIKRKTDLNNMNQNEEVEDDVEQEIYSDWDTLEHSNQEEIVEQSIASPLSLESTKMELETAGHYFNLICRDHDSERRKEIARRMKLPLVEPTKPRSKFYKKDPVTGILECLKCTRTFKEISTFFGHYSAIHLFRKKCNACNKVFKLQRVWTIHSKTCGKGQQSVTNHTGCKIVCAICKKSFKTTVNLANHRLKTHFGFGRFPCDLCDKTFKQAMHLQEHKDAAHFGKMHSCSYCDKSYKYRTNKRRHEQTCQWKTTAKKEDCCKNVNLTPVDSTATVLAEVKGEV